MVGLRRKQQACSGLVSNLPNGVWFRPSTIGVRNHERRSMSVGFHPEQVISEMDAYPHSCR
jgi:anthranilate/para-aminobenzoate synthase component II